MPSDDQGLMANATTHNACKIADVYLPHGKNKNWKLVYIKMGYSGARRFSPVCGALYEPLVYLNYLHADLINVCRVKKNYD